MTIKCFLSVKKWSKFNLFICSESVNKTTISCCEWWIFSIEAFACKSKYLHAMWDIWAVPHMLICWVGVGPGQLPLDQKNCTWEGRKKVKSTLDIRVIALNFRLFKKAHTVKLFRKYGPSIILRMSQKLSSVRKLKSADVMY